MTARRTLAMIAALLALFAFACSSDDGGGESKDVPPGSGAGSGNDAAGAAKDAGPTVKFTAILADFQSKAPKEGADLVVLDNETGEPLDPVLYPPFKSGLKGVVELDLPAGIDVGFKASGEDVSGFFVFKDSYQFNIPSDAKDEVLYAVNEMTYAAALSTGFVAQTDEKVYGHLAGTLYYVTPEGVEDFIGCAFIEVTDESGAVLKEKNDDPDGRATFCGIRYFDPGNDLPTSLKISDMTHLANSRYMVANLPEGQYTITARWVDDPDTALGSVTLRTYPGALSIGNIYVKGDKNPTPGDEKCLGDTSEH